MLSKTARIDPLQSPSEPPPQPLCEYALVLPLRLTLATNRNMSDTEMKTSPTTGRDEDGVRQRATNASMASSEGSPTTTATARPRRLKKRVYLAGIFFTGLVVYSVVSEGIRGLITLTNGIAAVVVMWMAAWHLFLKKIPTFHTFVTILLSPYQPEPRPITRRRRVVLDYGDGDTQLREWKPKPEEKPAPKT